MASQDAALGSYTDTFGFDLAGNRVSKVHDAVGTGEDEAITSSYNDRDQLISGDSTIEAHDAGYTYDANGSQATVSKDGQTTGYEWDLRNRMVGIDANNDGDTDDAGDTRYGYDESGQRVSQRTGSGETSYYLNDKLSPAGYPQIIEQKQGTAPATAGVVAVYVVGLRVEGQRDAGGTLCSCGMGTGRCGRWWMSLGSWPSVTITMRSARRWRSCTLTATTGTRSRPIRR